ncbi:MAG: hypothetical protein JWP89_4177 [Schlesneria sp.]|nr:hypothetical protein [Schlesneria sp.]
MAKRKKQKVKRNDGQELEQLVTYVESALIPKGFTVESRNKLFGDDGVQYAEFDIIISGFVGSIPLRCLIECRDRAGTAPGEWIEQLIGRQRRFGFQKVMAVSTSGFSPSAVDAAKFNQIELRSLASLSVDEIVGWFPMCAPMLNRKGDLQRCRVVIADGGIPSSQLIRLNEPMFKTNWTADLQSLNNLWHRIVNTEEVWNSVPHGISVRQTILASVHLPGNLICIVDGVERSVHELEFDGIFSSNNSDMLLVGASRYADALSPTDNQKVIADSATWKSPSSGRDFDSLTVTLIRNPDGEPTNT